MAELIGSIVVLIGAVFVFSAGLGMLRMPDALTRIQAGTKASTLGNTLVLVGIAFCHPDWGLKLLIVIYFVLMTNPVSSHALARVARIIPVRGGTIARCRSDEHGRSTEGGVMRRTGVVILIALLGLIFATVAVHYSERNSLPALAEAYVDMVTGILLTYRASRASSARPT